MSREVVAHRIHWAEVVWLVGAVNPSMMLPQLYQLWRTGATAGISLGTIAILTLIQGAFSLHGFFIRDRLVMISNGIAFAMSVLTAASVLYFRP